MPQALELLGQLLGQLAKPPLTRQVPNGRLREALRNFE